MSNWGAQNKPPGEKWPKDLLPFRAETIEMHILFPLPFFFFGGNVEGLFASVPISSSSFVAIAGISWLLSPITFVSSLMQPLQ